jgi:hypothetical protein
MRMVCWLEFLRQLNLVSMQMQIFRENSLHGASRNVQLLWTMAKRCSGLSATHTHCGNFVERPAGTMTHG